MSKIGEEEGVLSTLRWPLEMRTQSVGSVRSYAATAEDIHTVAAKIPF
jgi:hypothetical protein